MKPLFATIVLAIAALVARGGVAQDAPLKVIATTTILADVAQNVAGDLAAVTSLLPPNADTHSYQFTPHDVARVAEADLVLVVGAGYEGFLGGLLENAGVVEPVIASNGVAILYAVVDHDDHDAADDEPFIGVLGEDLTCQADDEEEADEEGEDAHEHGECDPHVWMNPANVIIWTENIATALAAADPANAAAYRANAAAYITQLEALDAELRALLAAVPDERRVLVTNHAFLAYFAQAYGFEVAATVLPGISTGVEPGQQALAALVDRVRDEGVAAIFVEVSASPQLAEVVAQEAGINVVTTLYTEALSDAGGPASTYLDYMRANARTIAAALSGS